MKTLIFGLLGFLIASCATVDVQNKTSENRAFLQSIGIQTIGSEIIIDRYCITQVEDDVFIQIFIDTLQKNGQQAYINMLNSPLLPCWDARMHDNVPAVAVILLKKIKDIRMPNGEELTFWMVKAKEAGLIGYIWLSTEGQKV